MKLENGVFRVQGIDVLELVKTYQTPLYVYDSEIIKRQLDRLKHAFNVPELGIHFACKALNNINILRLLKSWGAGLDTVSIQEIWTGIHAGFDPSEIIYTPNCVGPDEIEMAISLGVQINIDHIETLEYIGQHYPDTKICIRINPHVMAGGNDKISVGHIDSKFGISIYQMPLVERLVKALKLNINGLHMHTGSDILDPGVFGLASDILFDVARKFSDLEFIDFGSGLKVPYKEDDVCTDVEEIGEMLSLKFNQFCNEYGRKLNHHILNISNPAGKPRVYNVVGYICETDTFASNRVIPEIHPGDILCFENAGAYCFTMSSNYNSRFKPAEVLVHNGAHHLVRNRDTIDDLLRNQIQVI